MTSIAGRFRAQRASGTRHDVSCLLQVSTWQSGPRAKRCADGLEGENPFEGTCIYALPGYVAAPSTKHAHRQPSRGWTGAEQRNQHHQFGAHAATDSEGGPRVSWRRPAVRSAHMWRRVLP